MYFPKSQIKPNLYTSGNEFALESDPTTSYVGFYYEISTGEVFTGKTPQDSGNLSLIPIIREGDKFGSYHQNLLSHYHLLTLYFTNPPHLLYYQKSDFYHLIIVQNQQKMIMILGNLKDISVKKIMN